MKTEIDLIEKTEDGTLIVRLKKFSNDDEFRYHRTSILPGEDIDKQMEAVNQHIERLGKDEAYVRKHGRHAPCPDSEISKVKNFARQK